MQQISDWGVAIVTAVATGFAALMAALPTIIGAVLVLVIGWIVAGWLGGLVAKLARAIHIDTLASRSGVNDFLARANSQLKASDVLGDVVTWVVRLVFLEMAADRLGFTQVTLIINQVLGFIPNIIVAMIVLAVGVFLGGIVAGLVRASAGEARIGNPELLGKLTYGAVMAFAIIVALNEVNVAPVVINTLLIGLVAALALALGLAFGLGGRDTAAKYWETWSSNLEDAATKATRVTKPTVNGDILAAGASALPATPSRQR